ncbi:hypothetical protein JCM6882_007576 [Rhodosporidiobolus microsporus]
MVKVGSASVCPCGICVRSRTSSAPISALSPSTQPTGDAETVGAESKRAVERVDDAASRSGAKSLATPRAAAEPIASTSQKPYLPPASVRLPDELLEIIFSLARPPLPAQATQRDPLPLSWRTFARLALVHSRWHNVARQELARVVILRTPRQLKALTAALKAGHVSGKVEEILLEFKETESGRGGDAPPETDAAPGSIVLAGVSGDAIPTTEQDLVDLLEICGDKLKNLRLRGFGEPALVDLSPSIRQYLRNLEVFEYSPIDGAHAPSTAGLIVGLGSLPNLKKLILHPSNRYLTPLRELPDSIVPGMTRLLDDLPALLSDPTLRTLYNSAFSDVGLHHLTSLSLHSLALTPLTLLGLLFPSLTTLTSLTLSSTFFVGPASSLFNLLALLAPQLEEFVWEDKLINPIPAAAPLFLRHLGQSSLPAEAYWDLLKQLKKVKKLRLFSPHAFESSPSRAGFVLPPDLEELSIGSRSEVESEDLEFWLERIEALLDSKEPAVEVTEEEEGGEGEEEETVMGEIEEADEEGDGDGAGCAEKGHPGDDSGIALTDDEDDSSASSNLSRTSSSSSSSDTRAPLSSSTTPSPFATSPSPALSSPADIARPSSAPPSLSSPPPPSVAAKPPSTPPSSTPSPTSPATPPSSPPSTPSKRKRSSARKRRLSWRNPPLPPTPPQLRRLTLCTLDTTLRDDAALQDRIEEVVERGVGVEWYSLMVVVLETLELTRELRIDMMRVPGEEEWA